MKFKLFPKSSARIRTKEMAGLLSSLFHWLQFVTWYCKIKKSSATVFLGYWRGIRSILIWY
jgi:hypothetical protein